MFNTNRFANLLGSRLSGGMEMQGPKGGGLMMLWPQHPLAFLTMPVLWIGWAISAVCVILAVRLRRYRDPI